MPLHQMVYPVFVSVSRMPFAAILIFIMLTQLEIEAYKEKERHFPMSPLWAPRTGEKHS